jgi:hypothetical protein
MAASILTESYVRGTIIVADDAMATARNIVAHESLFRVGAAIELMTFVSDVTLITALYVILAPVNRHLALYAAALRLVAVAVAVMMVAGNFDVLRILGGSITCACSKPIGWRRWRGSASARMGPSTTWCSCSSGWDRRCSATCGSSRTTFRRRWRGWA